jgi:hypothetical protein
MADHPFSIALDPLMVKQRLGQLALPPPKISLAKEEAVAKGRGKKTFQGRRLLKLGCLANQNLVDQVGIIDQNVGPVKRALHRRQIAIALKLIPQKA